MAEPFSREVLKTVVAQICKHVANDPSKPQGITGITRYARQALRAVSVGDCATDRSALEAFTDVLYKYVTECGYFAHLNCELSGRTECNLIDVQYALDKLSTPIPDLWKFFNTRHLGEEVHFAKVRIRAPHAARCFEKFVAQVLPRFPTDKKSRTLSVRDAIDFRSIA
jgi:hypothetical protein